MGTMLIPYLNGVDDYFLSSGEIGPFRLSSAELRELLERNEYAVRLNDQLRWSTDLSVEDF
jgi:hypothetical protein